MKHCKDNNTVDVCSIIKSKFMEENRNNIGLIATLTCIYEGKKVAMRTNEDFNEAALDVEFNQILSRISELSFEIKRMSFHELLSKSIFTNQKQSKLKDAPLTMFSESKELYRICRMNILCWQTDIDKLCHEIKTQYSPDMKWIIKATKDYLKYNMLLIYPYLEDSVGFGMVLDQARSCKPIYCYDDGQLPTSNLDLISFLIMIGYCGGKCKRTQTNKEYFHYLIMELSYLNLELDKIDFVDLLHSAISEQSNLTYYSDPEIIRQTCKEYLWDEETDMGRVDSVVGYGLTEWDWVADLTYLFIACKMDWMYPYLKNEEAFANYVESLKNNENDDE